MKFVTSTYRGLAPRDVKLDESGQRDINDSSSDDDEPLARQLSFEDAEGVLPALRLTLSHDKKVQKFARARFPRYVQYCGASQAYVKFCNPR